ncbi:hypothetical protein HG531_006416 [Fusarium graminearum]|nr:hypothetical protein HG531_006416 [Fusarium graminearum]
MMTVETESKQEAGMAVVEVLIRLVVENPRRIDALSLRRYSESSSNTLMEKAPTDLLFRELSFVYAHRGVCWLHDAVEIEPADVEFLRD